MLYSYQKSRLTKAIKQSFVKGTTITRNEAIDWILKKQEEIYGFCKYVTVKELISTFTKQGYKITGGMQ